MIMVSSFYSVQYIVNFLIPFFHRAHRRLHCGTYSHSTLPIDKYCVFAHNIRYLIHTNKND